MKVRPTKGEGLSLIGIRVSSVSEAPEIYTIFVYNGKDSPVVVDGSIAFIGRHEDVAGLYELFHDRLKKLGPPPTEVDLICDIPEALRIIRRRKRDDRAVVLNCLNTMFDLLYAVNAPIPDECKSVLYKLADHLTFNQEFDSFIKEAGLDRESIVNAVLWCVGAVVVKSRIMS